MAEVSLSVVLPVFNEAAHLPRTIDALLVSLEGSGFDTEIVVVDDGSTDGSAAGVRTAVADRFPLRVIEQVNRGRFEARRAGVDAARGRWVLFLDARVEVSLGALSYVHQRAEAGADVWTAHVDINTNGNRYAIFWKLLAELSWRDYFDEPRETSFGAYEFDRFPKGTTCFFAPRDLLIEAINAFRSRYADLRQANDDTPLLRWIAERHAIWISPEFRCVYTARATFTGFLRHALHRGVVFVDGHGRPESRFFPVVVAFYPLSLALAAANIREPVMLPAVLVATGAAAGAFGVTRGRDGEEIEALALLTPPYALAHGLGMWRGLASIVMRR